MTHPITDERLALIEAGLEGFLYAIDPIDISALIARLREAEDANDWNYNMDEAPKDGTRIMLATPWGVAIGEWVEESSQSDCSRAVSFAGWWTAEGETQPGHNMGDESDRNQQCPPYAWRHRPSTPTPVEAPND